MKGYNESNHTVSTSKSQKENVQNHGDMNGRKCGICHKTGIMLQDVLTENKQYQL